jgi:hypothetical protein
MRTHLLEFDGGQMISARGLKALATDKFEINRRAPSIPVVNHPFPFQHTT